MYSTLHRQEHEELLYYLLARFMEDQRFPRNCYKQKTEISGGGIKSLGTLRATALKCAITNEVSPGASPESHLPKCCDRNVHIKLFACTIFVKKYNSKWFCPEWRKHCTLHWSYLFKKQQLQQTIWVYPSSCHKDAQYPQFAAWKTTATAAIPSSGAGVGMAGESHRLKCHRFDMSLQSLHY